MIEKEFDADQLYNRIVHYYIDKKGYSKEQANSIAQGVIRRETRRRICANPDCGHPINDHIENSKTCLVVDCICREFVQSVVTSVEQG